MKMLDIDLWSPHAHVHVSELPSPHIHKSKPTYSVRYILITKCYEDYSDIIFWSLTIWLAENKCGFI